MQQLEQDDRIVQCRPEGCPPESIEGSPLVFLGTCAAVVLLVFGSLYLAT